MDIFLEAMPKKLGKLTLRSIVTLFIAGLLLRTVGRSSLSSGMFQAGDEGLKRYIEKYGINPDSFLTTKSEVAQLLIGVIDSYNDHPDNTAEGITIDATFEIPVEIQDSVPWTSFKMSLDKYDGKTNSNISINQDSLNPYTGEPYTLEEIRTFINKYGSKLISTEVHYNNLYSITPEILVKLLPNKFTNQEKTNLFSNKEIKLTFASIFDDNSGKMPFKICPNSLKLTYPLMPMCMYAVTLTGQRITFTQEETYTLLNYFGFFEVLK